MNVKLIIYINDYNMIMWEIPWLRDVEVSDWVNFDYKVNYQLLMYYTNWLSKNN